MGSEPDLHQRDIEGRRPSATGSVSIPVVPDFAGAGRRHLDDAKKLNDDDRLPNADHLAGLAAECSLKAILIRGFGVAVGTDGRPTGHAMHGHDLWVKSRIHVRGRFGSQFFNLLKRSPFNNWGVDQRYDDGAAITALIVDAHLLAADSVTKMLHQLETTGRLP